MIKNVYFVKTNGYDMLVSVDEEKNCRYLTETNDFPNIVDCNKEEEYKIIAEFLDTVEDDSSWADDCTYEQIFDEFPAEIVGEIKKEL